MRRARLEEMFDIAIESLIYAVTLGVSVAVVIGVIAFLLYVFEVMR